MASAGAAHPSSPAVFRRAPPCREPFRAVPLPTPCFLPTTPGTDAPKPPAGPVGTTRAPRPRRSPQVRPASPHACAGPAARLPLSVPQPSPCRPLPVGALRIVELPRHGLAHGHRTVIHGGGLPPTAPAEGPKASRENQAALSREGRDLPPVPERGLAANA